MQWIVDRRADAAVVILSGRLDALSASAFETALLALLAESPSTVLDMADVAYISSAGLRVLVLGLKHCAEHGGRLRVSAVQPTVYQVLAMTQLADKLDCPAPMKAGGGE
ncbi:MAG: STAS domain-containing protein [Planctomycetia bacterium]